MTANQFSGSTSRDPLTIPDPLYHQGDSGRPLSYESNGQHILIGDVSYGDGCAKVSNAGRGWVMAECQVLVNFQAGFYGVYGRISFYRTWIEGKMTSPKFCSGTANAGA